jgi:hypothetical protein
MDDERPSIVYRPSSKAGTLLRFDALSYVALTTKKEMRRRSLNGAVVAKQQRAD